MHTNRSLGLASLLLCIATTTTIACKPSSTTATLSEVDGSAAANASALAPSGGSASPSASIALIAPAAPSSATATNGELAPSHVTDAGSAGAVPSPLGADAGAASAAPLDPKAELRLHHGQCFGNCAELTLKLLGDGTFTGRGAPKSLDANTTQEIFALATKAFDPAPRCPSGPTDIQYTTVTFVRDGAKRSAVHVRSMPCSKALSQLESKLEAIR